MIERMITDIAKFIKSQGELHYICKTMLKIPYTGKSRLVLEAVQREKRMLSVGMRTATQNLAK